MATLPFPAVTALNIVSPADNFKQFLFGSPKTFRIETNASDEFKDLIKIRSVPEQVIEVRGYSELSGGRMSWMIDLSDHVKASMEGKTFEVIVEILSPSGDVLMSESRKGTICVVYGKKPYFDLPEVEPILVDFSEEIFGCRSSEQAIFETSKCEGKLRVYINQSHSLFSKVCSSMKDRRKDKECDMLIHYYKLFVSMFAVKSYLYQRVKFPGMSDEAQLECKKYIDSMSDSLVSLTSRFVDAQNKILLAEEASKIK